MRWDRRGLLIKALCLGALTFVLPVHAQSTLDDSFDVSLNGTVSSISLQADGRILVGGGFTIVNGSERKYIVRLNADGSVDPTFSPANNPAQFVSRVQVMDSKIYVSAGDGLRRFAIDGTLDWHYPMNVATFAVDSEQRVIVGGQFNRVEGQYHRNIARLTSSGALDSTFAAAIGCCAGEGVDALAVQGDRVLVGGLFQSVNVTSMVSHIVRLSADGAADAEFAASATPRVSVLTTMPDGKFFRAGQTLVRHLPNGAEDAAFPAISAGGFSDQRFVAVAVGPDGKAVVGGNFSSDGGVTRTYVARFENDGRLDKSFTISPDAPVQAIAVQSDGRVLIGGLFTSVNGTPRSGIARVNTADAPVLNVARALSGQLVLSWPQVGGNFSLEAAGLDRKTWSPMGVSPVVVNGKNFVTNTVAGAGQFFRLRAQP